MPKVVDFPRKLEWRPLESWLGRVPNTHLIAKVESTLEEGNYAWYAWNGTFLVGMGAAKTLEQGQEAAKRAFETNALVIYEL